MKTLRIFALGLTLIAASAAAGCATSDAQLVATAPLETLRGHSVALLPSEAGHADPIAVQANAQVLAHLHQLGAVEPTSSNPDYQAQVSLSVLPAKVAVSRAGAGAPVDSAWSSAPAKRRFWQRSAPGGYALSLVMLDTKAGKVAFTATVTDHGKGPPEKALDRLVDALFAPPKPAKH